MFTFYRFVLLFLYFRISSSQLHHEEWLIPDVGDEIRNLQNEHSVLKQVEVRDPAWREGRDIPVSGSITDMQIDGAIIRAARIEDDEKRRRKAITATARGRPRQLPFHGFFSYGKQMSAKEQAIHLSNRSAVLLTATKILLGDMNDHETFPFSSMDIGHDDELHKLSRYDISRILPESNNNRCTPKYFPCNEETKYRSYNGWCNNLKHPHFGNTFNELKRLLPSSYEDGIDEPRSSSSTGNLLPNPRVVSNVIHHDRSLQHPRYSHLLMQMGQLIDHDLTHTPFDDSLLANCSRCDSPRTISSSCLPIPVPHDDPHFLPGTCLPFVRSLPGQRTLGSRNQLNQISSYLDVSPIYGSTDCEAEVLREGRGGRMLITRLPWGGGDTLLQRDETEECRSAPRFPCFSAGDDRNSQHPALVSLQSVLLRHHNAIADGLVELNSHWTDERIYQEARRILSAQWAHIVYSEYLPKIIGREAMEREDLLPAKSGYFDGYDTECDATISQPFATAAFRFGHSTIGRFFPRLNTHFNPVAEAVDIADNFDNTTVVYDSEDSIDSLILGLIATRQMSLDRHVTDGVRNHLFAIPGTPRSGMDLIAINIQRGRDHGVGAYNAHRQYCGLSKALSFFSLKGIMREETIERLQQVYESVDDIDLYTGIVSEIPEQGALVGPTAICLIGEQFKRLKRCDRFYYENGHPSIKFTADQLNQIRKTSLASVLCSNTAASRLPRDVLSLPHHFLNELQSCKDYPRIDLRLWKDSDTCFRNGIRVRLGERRQVSDCTRCLCTANGLECSPTSDVTCIHNSFDLHESL